MRTLTILTAVLLLAGLAGVEQADASEASTSSAQGHGRPTTSATELPGRDTGAAHPTGDSHLSNAPRISITPRSGLSANARAETLWIFDADFEDLLGDNAGWIGLDMSGTLGQTNYWHKDTIRISGFDYLGDSTWWCGTYNPCWRQPRGYGNDWIQILERSFPEVAANTDPGDELYLVYDQRYAIEQDYDYGYTDISTDGGQSWTTIWMVDNPGFAGTPGMSQNWNSVSAGGAGHMTLDVSDYAGQEIALRFRFESDCAYSSQDQFNNPPLNSCLDGAWQLDNISFYDGYPSGIDPFWIDDCESPGNNGWVHDDIPATGQAGVGFWRALYGTDIWTNRAFSCDEQSGWMYAAVDSVTSRMVDNEYAWLMSPPINIEGAVKLVGQWEGWIDFPRESNDIFNLWLSSQDDEHCVHEPDGFVDECPGWWYGGPTWGVWSDDWDAFAGNPWLGILWQVAGETPMAGYEHMGGFFLNRQRVGVPTFDTGTSWEMSPWYRFNDWFVEQLDEALLDTARVRVIDHDYLESVLMMCSDDSGGIWHSYPCLRYSPESNDWKMPPPADLMSAGAEIRYYLEAVDELGNTSRFPHDAPDTWFEFSILPKNGSVSEPGILLVDKDGGPTPGEDRAYTFDTEYYYHEMLDILGYAYDVYDVEVPGSISNSGGPDTCGMKYYDTQIWFTGATSGYLFSEEDQYALLQWLAQSSTGKERNLLLTGNDVGKVLDGTDMMESWLATDFVSDAVGYTAADTLPGLSDAPGGFSFMTHGDGECVLRGGCPEIAYFDVLEPVPAVAGAESAVEYVKADATRPCAGVAYTDTSGYQAVVLGFGMEYMSDALMPNGHFAPGVSDRVDLMSNIMDYFGKTPTEPPTGAEAGASFVYSLSNPRPNPFSPATALSFTMAREGHVVLRVYDVSGRAVRTLVDGEREPGEHRAVWNGVTDSGDRAASGVYFVKMDVTGDDDRFSSNAKLLLLR